MEPYNYLSGIDLFLCEITLWILFVKFYSVFDYFKNMKKCE